MAKFRIENFLDQLDAYLKSNLNTYITAINTEFGDDLTIETLNENAFIYGSLDERVKNFDNFLFYFIDETQAKTNGPMFSESFSIEIVIFIPDKQDFKTDKRALRYWEALKDLVRAGWRNISPSRDFEMESVSPFSVDLFNNSDLNKVFGIKVNFEIV